VNKPDFHAFYNVGTLTVLYSKIQRPFAVADCWLAAENLMLAACAKGLGACVIGFAVSALNTPEWKAALSIPAEMTAIAPIIVGVPAGETPPVPRKQRRLLPGNRKIPSDDHARIAKALVTCGKGRQELARPQGTPRCKTCPIAEARLQFAQQQPLGRLGRVFSRRISASFASVHTC